MSTRPAAMWVEENGELYKLRLHQPRPNVVAEVARVTEGPSKGQWFWDHYPWHGQWGIAPNLAEAKRLAGLCYKTSE